MKIYTKIILFLLGILHFHNTFSDNGIIGEAGSGATGECPKMVLKTGDIHTCHIPQIIVNMIDFFMGIAGTIAIIFIIIGGYQILFGSLENDKTKGKNTVVMALMGFAFASLSWFIIKLIFDNF
ncbi:hypothetical protein CSA08_01830 [Candidatus Gracilibacteria bacterium]|nr:MAG: hypothetical protein CSA08_01830 [Candidatus Gracilibacteria bacterium]